MHFNFAFTFTIVKFNMTRKIMRPKMVWSTMGSLRMLKSWVVYDKYPKSTTSGENKEI